MADSDPPPGARGDEAELFRAYNDELMRTVARSVHGLSQQTIEDACAFAWAQSMSHQPDRDRNWPGRLVRTAEREAWALSRREQRQIGFQEFDRATANVPAHPGTPDSFQIQQDVEDALAADRAAAAAAAADRVDAWARVPLSDISAITGDSIGRIGQLASLANQEIADMLATSHQPLHARSAYRSWNPVRRGGSPRGSGGVSRGSAERLPDTARRDGRGGGRRWPSTICAAP